VEYDWYPMLEKEKAVTSQSELVATYNTVVKQGRGTFWCIIRLSMSWLKAECS